jgi:hypothetical protein
VNSAAGSALIAGILSGVFVIVGVLLGTWLQSRSAERERVRAASGQRDEILAALNGAVSAVLSQALVWRRAALRAQFIEPDDAAIRRQLIGKPPDPQIAGIEAEIERLRRDVISVVSEMSVLVSRLGYIEPAMLPLGERLGVAVDWLIADIGASKGFQTRLDEVRQAAYAMNRKRGELTEQDGPQGRRAKRRAPDGKPQASQVNQER